MSAVDAFGVIALFSIVGATLCGAFAALERISDRTAIIAIGALYSLVVLSGGASLAFGQPDRIADRDLGSRRVGTFGRTVADHVRPDMDSGPRVCFPKRNWAGHDGWRPCIRILLYEDGSATTLTMQANGRGPYVLCTLPALDGGRPRCPHHSGS